MTLLLALHMLLADLACVYDVLIMASIDKQNLGQD